MEADSPSAPPTAGTPKLTTTTTQPPRLRQQKPLQRNRSDSTPTPISSTLQATRSLRDLRFRRPSEKLLKDGGKTMPMYASTGAERLKTPKSRPPIPGTGSGTPKPKPLFPVSGRKSNDTTSPTSTRRKYGQGSRDFDITPDGGSAGREGRHFAVANVGHNGRIYLRPTVRPANQRYPQPPFVFPMTPPDTAGLEHSSSENDDTFGESTKMFDNQWASTPDLPTPPITRRDYLGSLRRPGHRRAASDSTLADGNVVREPETGGFKVIITQPNEGTRPRTVEDTDMTGSPLLEVAIPSWRIGTPRFSIRGTPFIRGSSYAPTEEILSSSASVENRRINSTMANCSATPGTGPIHGMDFAISDHHVSGIRVSSTSPASDLPLRATYMSTHLVIEPAMFDQLTFQPACNDRVIVRYSPNTGAVTAATPSRLVAEITSPSFLDYDLVSDFFLTYRQFLDSHDLLSMLFARLRWALARGEGDLGTVVRVRTFVALRHWILNYFMDDFVVDYDLRVSFCNLLNDVVDEWAEVSKAHKIEMKTLPELKKCWRRICSQFWDGPDFDASLAADIPITPGGIAGHRDPNLTPSFWVKYDKGPPQLDELNVPATPRGPTSFYAEIAKAGHIDSIIVGDRPGTPENPEIDEPERNQASPTSITSVEVVSCSFPIKSSRHMQISTNHPLTAHPADPSSVYNASEGIATTPRSLTGKRVRPQHSSHKRNNSLSDSLHDHGTLTEKVLYKNAEFLLTLPYAGSLIQGNMFPPGQAFVEVRPNSAMGDPARQTTVFQPVEVRKDKFMGSAMSGHGMKKLLGSVRRALSHKTPNDQSNQAMLANISPIGSKGATTNRLPGTAIVPQSKARQNGARPPVRIDLLGAGVAEDFKKAVREDAAVEAERIEYAVPSTAGNGDERPQGNPVEYSAAHMDTVLNLPSVENAHPRSDMGISSGSESIVIVDGTTLQPVMSGALPAASSSASFAHSFIPITADPTPPNTPPDQQLGTPRTSSYILGQHALRNSVSADQESPIVPESTPGEGEDPLSEEFGQPSIDHVIQGLDQTPRSRLRGHFRNLSSRSQHSTWSARHGRFASYTSGIMPQPTIRSFDATTYSEESVADDSSQVLVPEPLRVLRRRPGGDLRGVTNVGDLDHPPLRPSRSVGSLTTYTDSFASSFRRSPAHGDSSSFVDVVTSDCNRPEVFSLGALAEQNPKRHLSLFTTHSSKPVMRPSFEAEAIKLAQIPDDEEDGGVEAALLKLEGKYERKSTIRLSMDLPTFKVEQTMQKPLPTQPEDVAEEDKKDHRHVHVAGEDILVQPSPTTPAPMDIADSYLDVTPRQYRNTNAKSFISATSTNSYNSIPLLERGIMDESGVNHDALQSWTDRSVLQPPSSNEQSVQSSKHPSTTSFDFVEKTDSMQPVKVDDAVPTAEPEHSFLTMESEDDTDLSSEMSAEPFDAGVDDYGAVPPSAIGVARSTQPAHPMAESQSGPNPPSPPITLMQALKMPLGIAKVSAYQQQEGWHGKPLPPTPDTTPTTAGSSYGQFAHSSPVQPTAPQDTPRNRRHLDVPSPLPEAGEFSEAPDSRLSAHLPFILAFDSEILAQQFTLIEKDALNEIDWRELIDMRWKNAEQKGCHARSWVSFLRDTDAHGVEVVIARFNIMVKWAISEIVLTRDLEERTRCIIKLIHIAAHCRRFRNFATMAQLTIALMSNEIGRLNKTWAMVPSSDQRTMHDLETLISPTRNFYNLRKEMEGGNSKSADEGCIPFVGIYTHDLLFNAQRPSEIASSPTTAPLVNFERCRIAAGVVKTLLKLLEASSRYSFQPIEGITERCLWMGALHDDEIRRLGESLE
ncbi:hypothetical protein SMACR_08254 [Sordaria macrospora]|uniref:Guanine nucleotide exchange factor LTE1 n=2 Tax=Sordaria macrospora TaxID=5147 RepID=A0A8S8ZPA8_SORMA|nr:putative RasGEF group protein [Sordaria macrospora k-hell]KAA8631238.1 hypothetical protein SMACR_08254 [Sordaria macrospora]WPJ64333.1 hypothetical protein SMAC4_08254 [Sordaria macrospora]CCC05245.1 putative RasGEF group protein [Sordaria macrospora k-hell]